MALILTMDQHFANFVACYLTTFFFTVSWVFLQKIRQQRKLALRRKRKLRHIQIIRLWASYCHLNSRYRNASLLSLRKKHRKTVWVKNRTCDIFKDVNSWSPNDWVVNLRMSRQTFTLLCDQLRSFMKKETTRFRRSIPVEKRVMITLWKLATNIEFRSLSLLFNIGRSTAHTIFHNVVKSMNIVLLKMYIKFPTGDSLRRVTDGFKCKWGFPQCAGAIDGTHSPLSHAAILNL